MLYKKTNGWKNISQEKAEKNTNTWRLNNTLFNNQEITEKIKEEIKKYLEKNDNENTTTQNLWDASKADRKSTRLNSSH